MNVAAATRATFIPDLQGSVIGTLNSASGALSKVGYSPYGHNAGTPGSFGYTGQRFDAETNGLYYYRARHYSAALGRFAQPDPIGYSGGVNLYKYVGNDPLNLIDPLGLVADAPWSNIFASGIDRIAQARAQEFEVWRDPQVRQASAAVLGGGLLMAAGAFAAAEVGVAATAVAGSRALVSMEQAAYTGAIRTIAGYEVAGTSGLVGSTYNMNIWGLYRTPASQGAISLINAVRAEASAAGASQISIVGVATINPRLMSINPAVAARLGLSFSRINPSTVSLRGPVR